MNRREFITTAAVAASAGDPRQAGSDAGGFRCGFAERDITPDIGMEEPGDYFKAYSTSFHDPCKVRAAVFDNGGARAAVVGIDAGMIGRPVVQAAREAIRRQCGIAPEAVMLAASHSHSSGPTGDIQPGEYDHASPLVRKLAYEISPMGDPAYLERVHTEIVAAVCHANSMRAAAQCSFGFGMEDQVAFNRRLRMKNGQTWTHPGKNNPEVLGFAGPTDPQVGVIGAWDGKGRLMGCCVNFACHATTSPGGISANYIYYLEQAIRGMFGPEVVVVFTAGASGDVTQVNNMSPLAERQPEDAARFVGGRVGAEAVKVLLSAPRGADFPVAANSRLLTIPHRKPAPARVREAYRVVAGKREDADPAQWIFAKETVMLDAKIAKESAALVEVQAVQVGPAVFVANPAEYFCAYGLEIKKRSPFAFTFPVSNANGSVGYVPTEEAFGPNGGGYETRLTAYSNLEIKAGTRIAEASVELCRSLSPGKAPEMPKIPLPDGKTGGWMQTPWAYGSLPPELE